MESEQNYAVIGVSASTHADQELLPSRMISGWDMHPTFLSDAELLGASCDLLLLCARISRRLASRTFRKLNCRRKKKSDSPSFVFIFTSFRLLRFCFFFCSFFFFAFSPLLLPSAVNPPLTELGFEDMSHTNNTIQQAHHKKEEVHFSDMNGARAVGVNNLPKLCWPEGEAPAAHPEQLQLQPHYPATTVSVAADAGAPLDVPTPPTDGVFARADIHSHMIPSL